jgi:hypothetical protein
MEMIAASGMDGRGMRCRLTSCDAEDRKGGKEKLLREHGDENDAAVVTSRRQRTLSIDGRVEESTLASP